MDFIDEQGFRANVGIILIDGGRRVLIAGRRGRGGWQFPQGGIRPDEEVEAAMFRELREEVGLERPTSTSSAPPKAGSATGCPSGSSADSRCRFASAKNSAGSCFSCAAHAERVRFDVTPDPEFDRCRWVDYWRPVKEVVYFKRPVYVRALHELGPLAFPDDGPPAPPSWWPRRWQRALNEH